jgi:hypothetical protein
MPPFSSSPWRVMISGLGLADQGAEKERGMILGFGDLRA